MFRLKAVIFAPLLPRGGNKQICDGGVQVEAAEIKRARSESLFAVCVYLP